MGLSAVQLRARALACLAQREHSRSELQRKLLAALRRDADRHREDPPADALERVVHLLDALVAQGLLSEQRYIDSRLRLRAPRFGSRRLAAELAQHQLAPDGDTWAQVQATELERAQALMERRFGCEPPPDAKELARRVRFLVSRGFATELALRLARDTRGTRKEGES